MKQALAALESVITIVLVLVGIVGISYQGFREDGWVTRGFGKIADAYINTPLIALALTVAMFFSYRAWRQSKSSGRGGKFFDLIVYFLMAAGTYFIARYVIRGEF